MSVRTTGERWMPFIVHCALAVSIVALATATSGCATTAIYEAFTGAMSDARPRIATLEAVSVTRCDLRPGGSPKGREVVGETVDVRVRLEDGRLWEFATGPRSWNGPARDRDLLAGGPPCVVVQEATGAGAKVRLGAPILRAGAGGALHASRLTAEDVTRSAIIFVAANADGEWPLEVHLPRARAICGGAVDLGHAELSTALEVPVPPHHGGFLTTAGDIGLAAGLVVALPVGVAIDASIACPALPVLAVAVATSRR